MCSDSNGLPEQGRGFELHKKNGMLVRRSEWDFERTSHFDSRQGEVRGKALGSTAQNKGTWGHNASCTFFVDDSGLVRGAGPSVLAERFCGH